MTPSTNIEIVGAKQAIIALRKIDPELRKQFNRDVKDIVKPVVDQMKAKYPQMPLSGMKRSWTPQNKSFKLFPYSQAAAKKGVKYKIDTSRKAVALIKIQQTNAGAMAFELTGKGGSTPFSRRLSAFAGLPIRVIWPVFNANEQNVSREIEKTVLAATNLVQKELN